MRSVLLALLLLVLAAGLIACGSDVLEPADSPSASYAAQELAKAAREPVPAVLTAAEALSAGGPDTFGYVWRDSDEPSGPAYAWTDISGTGTAIFGQYEDDDTYGPVPIGFPFPFYGNTFTELYVCSNGWISFTNSFLRTYSNQPLPNSGSSVPENLLAVLWDDMVVDPITRGLDVYYEYDGSRLIVQFEIRRIAAFDPPYYHFQAILYPNGRIVYQYEELGTTTTSCTVGIQNAAKDDGLLVVHNTAYLYEGLAVEFLPPADDIFAIKPGSEGSPINPKGQGVIPVVIYTTDTFDATMVDVSTLAFGPWGAAIAHGNGHYEDFDFDGDVDLLLHFRSQETGIASGADEACLTGQLYDGTPIAFCDAIRTVPYDTPTLVTMDPDLR